MGQQQGPTHQTSGRHLTQHGPIFMKTCAHTHECTCTHPCAQLIHAYKCVHIHSTPQGKKPQWLCGWVPDCRLHLYFLNSEVLGGCGHLRSARAGEMGLGFHSSPLPIPGHCLGPHQAGRSWQGQMDAQRGTWRVCGQRCGHVLGDQGRLTWAWAAGTGWKSVQTC